MTKYKCEDGTEWYEDAALNDGSVVIKPVKVKQPDALEDLDNEIRGILGGYDSSHNRLIARATVQAALEIMRADLAEVAKQDTEAMMRLEARIAKLEPGSERSTQIQIILSGVRR